MIRRTLAASLLLLVTAAGGRAAERPWNLVRGRNVTDAGQQSPRTLRQIAVELEQFRFALGAFIRGARQPPSTPTIVYAFDDRRSMEPFLPLYNGKPASLGGYCHCGGNDDVNYIVVDLGSFADSSALVFHEYTHLLVRNATPLVPVWLNEGLAEFYSTFRLAGPMKAEIGRPVERHVVLLRQRTIPIQELVAVTSSSALYNESERRSIFYAEAWALTHYLLTERENGAASINKYMALVASGTGAEQAFAQAFSTTPSGMDVELRNYVARPVFKSMTYQLDDRVEVDEPERAATLAPADAAARLGGIQLRVNRLTEAAPRIEAAAAAGPDLSEAQLALALLRIRQGRTAEARDAIQRAAALAPNDFTTQYLDGLLLLRAQADVSDDARAAMDEAAHAALTRAIAADPDSAEARAWQAYTDIVADTRLPEAHAAMVKAIELAPGRLDFRFRLAEVNLRLGNEAEARQTLANLVATSPDERLVESARSLLAAIDKPRRGAEPRESHGAAVSVPDVDAERPVPEPASPSLELRRVQPGEERAYGELVSFECSTTGFRFSLRVGSRTVVATARRMEDVQLTYFGETKGFSLSCGPRTPPDRVFLTWRTGHAAGDVVGEAVAVEFLPANYVP
jgi:tetratricopeptide (TPR) repeat protein